MSKLTTNKDYMLLAIKAAKKSTQPLPCGCVIVKNNQILSATFNSQRADSDPTAHAELKALREAGKQHGRDGLKGATVYCTCEPCIMCLSALSISGIIKLYYAVPLTKLAKIDHRITISTPDFLQQTPWKFTVVTNFLQAECLAKLYNINR